MGEIGSHPKATRAEGTDEITGNFLAEKPGESTDIPISGLRRSDLNYDTESISNAVRFLTIGVVRGKFANNGDWDINTDAQFTKWSNKFTGFGTKLSANRVGISGGLAVGAGFVGTTAPTNGAIIEGNLGVGTNALWERLSLPFLAKLAFGQEINFSFDIYKSSAGQLNTFFDSRDDNTGSVVQFRMRTDGTPVEVLSLLGTGGVIMPNLKSGATQGAAGAATNETWYTISHATLPDGVKMQGL